MKEAEELPINPLPAFPTGTKVSRENMVRIRGVHVLTVTISVTKKKETASDVDVDVNG